MYVSFINDPGKGFIVSQGDQYFILNQHYITTHYLFQWVSGNDLGVATLSHVNLIIYNAFNIILDKFGLNDRAVFLWIFSFLSLSFISCFLACKIMIKRISIENLFLCSFFYIFNQTTIALFNGWAFTGHIYFFIFFPLTFALFSKAIFSNKIHYSVLAGISSILLLPSFVHLSYFYVLYFVTFLFAFLLIVTRHIKITKLAVINIIVFYGTISMISAYWVLPSVCSIFTSISYNTGWIEGKESMPDWLSWQVVPFFQSFRLIFAKDWDLYPNFFQYGNILKPVIIVLSFFPASLLAFSLLKQKKNSLILMTVLFLLIYLFLMKKAYPPFAFLNSLAFKHIPALYLLRSTDKWMMPLTFFFAFILGLVLTQLNKEKNSMKIYLIVFAVIVVYPLPFWGGNLIKNNRAIKANGYDFAVKVPHYYNQMANYANALIDKDCKIMSEPYNDTCWLSYHWKDDCSNKCYYFIGDDPTFRLFSSPIINPKISIGGVRFGKKSIYGKYNNYRWYYALCKLLNVKYILFHEDSLSECVGLYKKNILNNKYLELQKKLEKLTLYKINSEFFLPHIYSGN